MAVKSKFKPEWYVVVYELAKKGVSDVKIAGQLGVSVPTLVRYLKKKPALRKALEKGRAGRKVGVGDTFADYCYGNLPTDVQRLWDEISEPFEPVDPKDYKGIAEQRIARREKCRKLLYDRGKRIRQRLFVHAMIAGNFSVSWACRVLDIPRSTVTQWEADPKFLALLQGVEQCKKDFFEGGLVDLVKAGDSAATIFANKTLNADRGYSEKYRVEHSHSGRVKVEHAAEGLLERLSPEAKQELLEVIRKSKEAPMLEDRSNVQDAEFEVKK